MPKNTFTRKALCVCVQGVQTAWVKLKLSLVWWGQARSPAIISLKKTLYIKKQTKKEACGACRLVKKRKVNASITLDCMFTMYNNRG